MLKLWIKGDKEMELELSNPSEAAGDLAVKQAFALFGVNAEVAATVEAPKKEVKVEEPVTPAVTYVEPPRPIYKPQHVHNKVETQATSMKEAVKEIPEGAPDFFKTGIKMKDGVPHYRCRYQCTKCGNKGNHYIPMGVSQVDCHECQTSNTVTKAIKGVSMIQDKFGNYYVAGAQLPVIDLTYANQKEKIDVLKKHKLIDKDYKGNV